MQRRAIATRSSSGRESVLRRVLDSARVAQRGPLDRVLRGEGRTEHERLGVGQPRRSRDPAADGPGVRHEQVRGIRVPSCEVGHDTVRPSPG